MQYGFQPVLPADALIALRVLLALVFLEAAWGKIRHWVVLEGVIANYRADKLPYAVLLDEGGRIAAKGLVNSREHFESLIAAKETGFATIQSYLKSRTETA